MSTASQRASTSIPYEIKVLLDQLETAEERPPALSRWAKDVFKAGRKHDRTNDEIAEWVEGAARAKHYSDWQIWRILKDNGVVRHPEKTHIGRGGRLDTQSYNYIGGFRSMVKAITGLSDNQLTRAHDPKKLADQSMPTIYDIAARNSDEERETLIVYVRELIVLLQRLEQTLASKEKRGIRLEP